MVVIFTEYILLSFSDVISKDFIHSDRLIENLESLPQRIVIQFCI